VRQDNAGKLGDAGRKNYAAMQAGRGTAREEGTEMQEGRSREAGLRRKPSRLSDAGRYDDVGRAKGGLGRQGEGHRQGYACWQAGRARKAQQGYARPCR
jgi:hypothetical protein